MAACDQRIGLDYFRLSADRRMLFGGLCNYSARNPQSIAAALQPQMGRIENNTYYVQGYSGHGLAPTHMAGQVLADAIGGDMERFDVFSRIRHLKLPGGKWFASPAMALRMLYYRLKDIL